MAQGKRGRPPKQPIATKIANALDVAQAEINTLIPKEEQESFVPAIHSPEIIVQEAPKITQDVKEDYEFARNNLHNLLDRGNKLLDGITDLSADSDSPRTFEVAGTLLKTLFEGTRELMTLQKDIRDVEKKSPSTEENTPPVNVEHADNITNNTIMMEGTTREMLQIMREMKQRKQIDQNTKDEGVN